jgi:hypothetical protein
MSQPEFPPPTDFANSNKVCTPAVDNAERELSENGEYRKGEARQENERGNDKPQFRVCRATKLPAIPSDVMP